MKIKKDTSDKIGNNLANIKHFESIEYEKTVSVFDKENQMRIHNIIKEVTKDLECNAFLDLCCGTWNTKNSEEVVS